MKESTLKRVSLFLLLLSLAAIIFAAVTLTEAHQSKTELLEGHRRTAASLSSDLSQMDAALKKLAVCTSSEGQSVLAADVWRHAAAAEQSLESLPLRGEEFANLEKYINRTGDFAYSLIRRAAGENMLLEDERKALLQLSGIAGKVCAGLQNAAGANFDPAYFREVGGALSGLSEAVLSVESDFPESPVLLYDGPFSDHMLSLTPACVAESPREMTAEEAKERAAKLFSLKPEAIRPEGEAGGDISAWCLSFSVKGGEVSLEMAKSGGGILLLLCDRIDGEATLSAEEALAKAEAAARSLGFAGVIPTYHYTEGDTLYANFAAEEGGICLYPDLVQIGISLADGSLVYAEGRGYLANHRPRSLSPVLTQEEAAARLYAGFEVLASRPALIPTAGKNERLCYEFHVRREDTEFLIYIDAKTGAEAQILQLLRTDGGTLTM
ncbi:MAG: germination protein YpeB [Clostridia bacterium]|nr:germination protein YpeB [Clostridia bacterium]